MGYAILKGAKSGQIKGSIKTKGHEDAMGVIAVQHSIVSPRDAASGLPTGKRMHRPFVFWKELDKASPLLLNMLVTNETITQAKFEFYAPKPAATGTAAGSGNEFNNYTVELVNASISSYLFRQPNVRDPNQGKLADYEKVGLVYQKITWTWMDGGITASDDWEAPQV
jgi:type VI secretion system secreted protein Hcp